jgi:GT2 family glycosyltransferase
MKSVTALERLLSIPRFLPLYLALWAARLGAVMPPRLRQPTAWGLGISVLIPESGTPDLLANTLAHAEVALTAVAEPKEIVVMVNGAPASLYQTLQAKHPHVVWLFAEQALGFNGAIAAGLQQVQYPGVYLLNSDMRLAADALTQLLPYRRPSVFAVGSQIFFPPDAERREETGWCDYYDQAGRTCIFDATPQNTVVARGTLYAGGGSSLFKTELLKEYVLDTHDYSPFYWEDADWGVRAWAEGLECLFVPTSQAIHEHRGTIKKRFARAEIDRIVDRNGLLFELRNHLCWLDGWRALVHLSGRPPATRKELSTLSVARGIASIRRQSMARQLRGFDFKAFHQLYATPHWNPQLPTVLWVTPFAVFPPAHGGARRIVELAKRLCQHVNLILLSDELASYANSNVDEFPHFQALYVVQGRQDKAGQADSDLPTRMHTHAPAKLRKALRDLQALHKIDLVQIEFMEATKLVEERQGATPFVAALHDVYLNGGKDDALQQQVLAKFDAVLACSAEDAQQLGSLPHHIVPNGASDRLATAQPSPDSGSLLFMGPFRYQPNYDGIVAFLTHCWPALLTHCPHATVVILAGTEATRADYQHAAFKQKGVQLITTFVDPAPYLADSVLTINPQQEIRGSALKVAESLLAQRICVSTQQGARGFANLQSQALQVVADWPAMTNLLVHLLQHSDIRHQWEQSAILDRQQLSWDGQAERLHQVYQTLLPNLQPKLRPKLS